MAYSWEVGATPTFRALSYDDYAKPLKEATDFHKEIETQYGDLDAKASMWEKLANDVGGKDSKAYNQYKKYAEDLRKQADDLASNGLRYNTRKNLLNMVGRYSSEITPIEEAWNRRKQLADEQSKLLSAHPELIPERYAGRESIDFFMDNPDWSATTLDSDKFYTRMAGEMQNIQRTLQNTNDMIKQHLGGGSSQITADVLKWVPSQVKGYYERAKQYGWTLDKLESEMNDPNSAFSNHIKASIAATGIDNMNFGYSYDDEATANARKKEAYDRLYAMGQKTGVFALGKPEFETLKDEWKFMTAQQAFQARENEKNRQHQKDMAAAKAGGGTKTDGRNFTFTNSGQVVSRIDGDDYQTSIRIRNANALSSLDLGNDKYNTYLKHIGKSGVDDITKRVLEKTGEKYKENNIDFSDPEVLKIVEDYVKNPSTHLWGNSRYLESGEVKDFMSKYNYESADDVFNRKKENGEYDNETLSKIDEADKALKKANDDLNYFETVSARNSTDYNQVQAERERLKSEIIKAENNLNNLRNLGFNGSYDYGNMDMFISDAIREQQNLRSTNDNDTIMFANYTGSLEANPQGRTTVTIIGSDGKPKGTKEISNIELSTELKNKKGSKDVMHFGGGYDPNSHTFGIWNANKVGGEMWRTPLTKEDLHLTQKQYDDLSKKMSDLGKVVYGDGGTEYQAGAYSSKQKAIIDKYKDDFQRLGVWDGNGKYPTRDEISMVMNNDIITAMEISTKDQFANWHQESDQGYDTKSSRYSGDNVDIYDYEVE